MTCLVFTRTSNGRNGSKTAKSDRSAYGQLKQSKPERDLSAGFSTSRPSIQHATSIIEQPWSLPAQTQRNP